MNQDKRGLKILIVEDSMLIVKRLWSLLSDMEGVATLAHAKDGNEAILLAKEINPDVIILDIKIPGKSGVEVLPELKLKSYAKVIMLTNYSDVYYKNLCLKLGAEYFLDKSNEFEKIYEILLSIEPVH
ncbi:MAG: response regulator transcription factor [Bacteroidota bacterium]